MGVPINRSMRWHSAPLLVLAAFVSTGSAEVTCELLYELRVPKTVKIDQSTRFYLATDVGCSKSALLGAKRREEGDLVIFSESELVFDSERRRAVIVNTDGQPWQVFRLKIPHRPKPADWTAWQRPDYVEKTDAAWTFMHDLKEHDRSTNVPPDSFELRFKITEKAP